LQAQSDLFLHREIRFAAGVETFSATPTKQFLTLTQTPKGCNKMKSTRVSLMSLAVGLAIVGSACGSSTKTATTVAPAATTAAPAATTAAPAATTAAAMADAAMAMKPVGAACSAVPATGSGSFDGMAKDPAATAASNNPLLSTLVAAVKAAGLVDTLNGPGPFTIFAPVNDAFAKIPKADLDKLLADPKGDLTKILTLHVVSGKMDADALVKAGTVKSLNGADLKIAKDGDMVKINGSASVICGNVTTGNAIVHIIDNVLTPAKGDAMAGAAMADKPIGAACSAVPATGKGSFDGMSADPAATAASNNPLLSTLVAAVTAAGLGDTLNGPGPFTIFAPTNDAFAKIDKATLTKLLADPKGDLTKILTFHVVPGKMDAAALIKAGSAKTVNGAELKFAAEGESVKINGASSVICGNVKVGNGIVHIIDTVLLPA
jgi:transforming growth factor-beta-induced protein